MAHQPSIRPPDLSNLGRGFRERAAASSATSTGLTGLRIQELLARNKGQEDLDLPPKMQRLRQWCEDINRIQADVTYEFVFVDEESFDKYEPRSFKQLLDGFREYKDEG